MFLCWFSNIQQVKNIIKKNDKSSQVKFYSGAFKMQNCLILKEHSLNDVFVSENTKLEYNKVYRQQQPQWAHMQ